MSGRATSEVFEACTAMPVSAEELYAWHARPGALQRLQPPWERIELVEQSGGIAAGARVRVRARVGPVWTTWIVRHEAHATGCGFTDVLERGPFAAWRHEHIFAPGAEGSTLIDRVTFRLPGGAPGRMVGMRFVRARLARLFRYRHAVTRGDLDMWRRQRDAARMKIAITGATGVLGSALVPFLTTQGHEVVAFSRGGGAGTVRWDPARNEIDVRALRGVDAVIHLAGANLGEGRWTDARMREIKESRVQGTRLLVDTLGQIAGRPRVFVCASAIGIYGDTGEAIADEESAAGSGFLADVCAAWEAEAMRAQAWGAREVRLRMGVILSPAGGALAKLAPVFRAGVGGHIGHGRQWMSWIALDDVLAAVTHVLATDALHGPVNVVGPDAATNRDFAATLAHVLGRPAVMHVPAVALRLMVGRMADEVLLASTRVRPRRLEESGFVWRFRELEPALRHVLGM